MAAVTNNNKRIANTALDENEQNIGPQDINETKPGLHDVPHCNKGRLSNAIMKTSDKTKFEGGNVVRKYDLVATEDAHAGIAGGESTHTYLFPSWATEGAPNVFTENVEPTRNTDATQQNWGNSEGQVVNPADVARILKEEAEKLKKCSLKEFEKAECSHGRKLTEDRILEVVASAKEPETIEFLAKRTNAVEPGDPECEVEPDHTAWVIARKKGGGLAERKEEFKGDALILEPSWFSETEPEEEDDDQNNLEDSEDKGDAQAEQDFKQARARAIHNRSKALRQQSPTTPGSVTTARDQFDQQNPDFVEQGKNQRQAIKDVKESLEKIAEIADFLKCWFARKDAVHIDVQAQACTGGQACKIVAFPADEVEWTLGESEKALVKRATDAVNKFADWLSQLLSPLGSIQIQIKVLDGANVKAKCQWKELTRDAPRPGLKRYQCNTKLTVDFNVEKLIWFEAKGGVPLARIIDIFFPGAGWVVQKVVNWLGLTAQVYVAIEFGIGITLGAVLNEYWEGEPHVEIKVTIKFSIGLEIRYRDNLHIDGRAVAKVEPTFDNPKFERDSLIAFDLADGKIQLGFEGTIYASYLWFEYNPGTKTWYPWEFPYGRQTLRPLRPLMALVKN